MFPPPPPHKPPWRPDPQVLVFNTVLEDGAARKVAEYLGARHDVTLAAKSTKLAEGAGMMGQPVGTGVGAGGGAGGSRYTSPPQDGNYRLPGEAQAALLPPDIRAARQEHADKRAVAAGMATSGELQLQQPDASGVVAAGAYVAGFPGRIPKLHSSNLKFQRHHFN